jgi:hypothetical protein
MTKRSATLADAFIAHRYTAGDPNCNLIAPRVIERVQAKARQARRFVFDDDASRRIGDVVREIPDLIVREAQFARAPFPLTWVEYNSVAMWRSVYREQPHKLENEFPDHAARIGYLIEENEVYVVAGGHAVTPEALNIVHLGHFAYELNVVGRDRSQILRDEMARRGLDAASERHVRDWFNRFFWSSTADHLDDATLDALSNRFASYPLYDTNGPLHGHMQQVMAECFGDLRNIIAILLMLNRPRITRYDNELPRSRGWLKNRQVPYLAHTPVTIHLDPLPILRHLGTPLGEAEPRRRHEVDGHYRHRGGTPGCIHPWVRTDEDWIAVAEHAAPADVDHWLCPVCERKRWWVKTYHRGDAARGYVTHDHRYVTP